MSNFHQLLQRSDTRPTHFNPIDLGEFSLSIQASDYHYSEPRENDLPPESYQQFEVALFYRKEWVKFRWWKIWYRGPWMKFHDGGDIGVFAYMPAEVVQKFFHRIKLLNRSTLARFRRNR